MGSEYNAAYTTRPHPNATASCASDTLTGRRASPQRLAPDRRACCYIEDSRRIGDSSSLNYSGSHVTNKDTAATSTALPSDYKVNLVDHRPPPGPPRNSRANNGNNSNGGGYYSNNIGQTYQSKRCSPFHQELRDGKNLTSKYLIHGGPVGSQQPELHANNNDYYTNPKQVAPTSRSSSLFKCGGSGVQEDNPADPKTSQASFLPNSSNSLIPIKDSESGKVSEIEKKFQELENRINYLEDPYWYQRIMRLLRNGGGSLSMTPCETRGMRGYSSTRSNNTNNKSSIPNLDTLFKWANNNNGWKGHQHNHHPLGFENRKSTTSNHNNNNNSQLFFPPPPPRSSSHRQSPRQIKLNRNFPSTTSYNTRGSSNSLMDYMDWISSSISLAEPTVSAFNEMIPRRSSSGSKSLLNSHNNNTNNNIVRATPSSTTTPVVPASSTPSHPPTHNTSTSTSTESSPDRNPRNPPSINPPSIRDCNHNNSNGRTTLYSTTPTTVPDGNSQVVVNPGNNNNNHRSVLSITTTTPVASASTTTASPPTATATTQSTRHFPLHISETHASFNNPQEIVRKLHKHPTTLSGLGGPRRIRQIVGDAAEDEGEIPVIPQITESQASYQHPAQARKLTFGYPTSTTSQFVRYHHQSGVPDSMRADDDDQLKHKKNKDDGDKQGTNNNRSSNNNKASSTLNHAEQHLPTSSSCNNAPTTLSQLPPTGRTTIPDLKSNNNFLALQLIENPHSYCASSRALLPAPHNTNTREKANIYSGSSSYTNSQHQQQHHHHRQADDNEDDEIRYPYPLAPKMRRNSCFTRVHNPTNNNNNNSHLAAASCRDPVGGFSSYLHRKHDLDSNDSVVVVGKKRWKEQRQQQQHPRDSPERNVNDSVEWQKENYFPRGNKHCAENFDRFTYAQQLHRHCLTPAAAASPPLPLRPLMNSRQDANSNTDTCWNNSSRGRQQQQQQHGGNSISTYRSNCTSSKGRGRNPYLNESYTSSTTTVATTTTCTPRDFNGNNRDKSLGPSQRNKLQGIGGGGGGGGGILAIFEETEDEQDKRSKNYSTTNGTTTQNRGRGEGERRSSRYLESPPRRRRDIYNNSTSLSTDKSAMMMSARESCQKSNGPRGESPPSPPSSKTCCRNSSGRRRAISLFTAAAAAGTHRFSSTASNTSSRATPMTDTGRRTDLLRRTGSLPPPSSRRTTTNTSLLLRDDRISVRDEWNSCTKLHAKSFRRPPSNKLIKSTLRKETTAKVEPESEPPDENEEQLPLKIMLFCSKGIMNIPMPTDPIPDVNTFSCPKDLTASNKSGRQRFPTAIRQPQRHCFSVNMDGFLDQDIYFFMDRLRRKLTVEGRRPKRENINARRIVETIDLPRGLEPDNLRVARDFKGCLHFEEAWVF